MQAKIDNFLARWERKNAPGLALAVVREGEVIYNRALGMANLDYAIPIHSRTVFRVASLAKQFTGACIGLLEEQGALTLNDDIRKWIPELPHYQAPVTVGQLLWHTSGIHDFPHILWGLSGKSFGDAVTEQGVLEMLSRFKDTDFRPGTRHLYCNAGYFLLAIAAARISGQSLASFAYEHIFAPLGMRNTHFHDDYNLIVPNRAIGYTPNGEGYAIMDAPTCTLVGDDGLFTTLEDMLIWEGNFYANKLGKGGLVDRMLSKGKLEDGSLVNYGYGLFLEERKGLDSFWHYGEFLGFQSVFRSFPQQKLSIICLGNTSELGPIDFAREIEDILLEVRFSHGPRTQPSPSIPYTGVANPENYAGLYCNRDEGFFIEVKTQESGLQMAINGRQVFDLKLLTEDVAEAIELDFPLGLKYNRGQGTVALFDSEVVFPLEPLAVFPQLPGAEDLAQLAGEYYSPILDAAWTVVVEEGSLRLINKDRHRISPQEPLTHVFEDFYVAWFSLWRRKIHFVRERGTIAMVVLNGDSGPVRFERSKG